MNTPEGDETYVRHIFRGVGERDDLKHDSSILLGMKFPKSYPIFAYRFQDNV